MTRQQRATNPGQLGELHAMNCHDYDLKYPLTTVPSLTGWWICKPVVAVSKVLEHDAQPRSL